MMHEEEPGHGGFAARYGPWAVIAGATDGTGAAYADRLAARGLNLLLVARREPELQALAEQLRGRHGREVRVLSADLSHAGAADRMAQAAQGLEVGLYVSNAGADTLGVDFLDAPASAWLALVDRNVRSVVAACHRFAGPMRRRGRGGLILMSSGAGMGGQARIGVYTATKAFDLNLAESLWAELRSAGVDVLGVVAPPMATPTLLKTLARNGLEIPGIYAPEDVVRQALDGLADGPCLIIPYGATGEEARAQAEARRERVVASSAMSAAFFGATGAA